MYTGKNDENQLQVTNRSRNILKKLCTQKYEKINEGINELHLLLKIPFEIMTFTEFYFSK